MSRKKLLLLALFTLVIFPLVGHIIIYFFGNADYSLIYRAKKSIQIQLAIGLISGLVFGYIAWIISNSKWVSPKSGKYLQLIGGLNLRHIDIVIISLCAGIGEELLFRGAIQPFFGIWITAFVFVLIHGYIDPRDWRMSIYGLSMTIIIAILGYMCEEIGIWSSAAAHAMIDYVLLQLMVKKWNTKKKMLTDSWLDSNLNPE